MNRLKRLLAMLVATMIFQTPTSATNLDVMIVFSSDSGLSAVEKALVATRYQVALYNVYGQLEGNQTVTVLPLLVPEMAYAAANKTSTQILQWMEDQNAIIQSPLRIGRESLGNSGADLILMVVPESPSTVCGAAKEIPLTTDVYHSESNAFAYVVLEESDPECLEEIVVPHEIGHLLYAEHEFDDNGDDLLPSYSNHATQSSTSSLKSLMWYGLDPNGTNLLSGFNSNMTTAWADNVEFMSTDSFDVAAAYRPIQQLTSCNIWFEFNSCNGSSASHSLSATIAAGFQIVNVDYDVSYNGSGWSNIFSNATNNSCPSFTSTVGMWGRAIFTVALGGGVFGESVWMIWVPQADCDPGGGGPNPF